MNDSTRSKRQRTALFYVVAAIAVGITVLLQFCCTTPPPPPPSISPAQNFDATHRLFNDMFGRAQRDRGADAEYKISSPDDLKLHFGDMKIQNGVIQRGTYRVMFDWKWSQSTDHTALLPPMIAIPVELTKGSSTQAYPVLLLRPEDNPPDALISKIRLHYLSREQIAPIVENDFDYQQLLERFQFITQHSPNYWPYYRQEKVREYFSQPIK